MQVQNNVEDQAKRQKDHANGVASAEAVVAEEQEGCGDTRRVSNGQMHAGREGTLSVPRVVDRDPGKRDAGRQKDADGDEEAAGVAHSSAGVGVQHAVADHGGADGAHDEVASPLGLVALPGAEHVDDGAKHVDGDGHGLNLGRGPGAEAVDDGGQEDDEGVEHDELGEEGDAVGPGGPVADGVPDVLLDHVGEVLCAADLGLVDEDEVALLALVEEPGRLGAVGQHKGDDEARDQRGQPVDEDDPPPRVPAVEAVHEADAVRHQAPGGARQGGRAVEERDAQGQRAPPVEHGQVQHHAGEEAGLEQPEDQAAGQERGKVVYQRRERRDDAPGQGQAGEVAGGLHLFDDHVGGGFEELFVSG